ncbi:MAG: lasso peptide biosynthesis B2 protein [Sphingomicrobium sp.]
MSDVPLYRWVPRYSFRELAQFAEAACALTVAWLAIKVLPFSRLMKTTHVGRVQSKQSQAQQAALGSDMRRAIKRAARRLPWSIVCFPEAMAAHWMLRRRGADSRLHYGLRSSDEKLSAHVWVTLGGEIVVGEEHDNPHRCVATFPQMPSA